MEVYLVVMYDRHVDDQYAVCRTLIGAQHEADEFRQSYGNRYQWGKQDDSDTWLYRYESGEEGPHVHIERVMLKP